VLVEIMVFNFGFANFLAYLEKKNILIFCYIIMPVDVCFFYTRVAACYTATAIAICCSCLVLGSVLKLTTLSAVGSPGPTSSATVARGDF
jgi:hypothetical protein